MKQFAIHEKTEEGLDASVRRLFTVIKNEGASLFQKGSTLEKWRDSNLLRNMIAHFEKTEEYEKCSFLKVIEQHLHFSNI